MGHTKTSERKKDHIELAFQSVVNHTDSRFYYEPLFNGHPNAEKGGIPFLGKMLDNPIWVSSMTGGTEMASKINKNLAKACGDFGMGMGLGSCRIILEDNTYLTDFQLRKWIGEYPLYANLGIAQLEQLFDQSKSELIKELINKTETDGLIIHVNPLQEWLQPEGDRFNRAPLDTIKRCLDLDINLVVKEVGQGFGPESLEALMSLPLMAIDFGASGGTNFSKLEMHRSETLEQEAFEQVANWGHTAEEMISFYNDLSEKMGESNQTQHVIVSGGVKNFMDGYYAINKINANAVYGQASAFLKHAIGSYEQLQEYVSLQVKGLHLAQSFLKVR